MEATKRSSHFMLREWETSEGFKKEVIWSDSCLIGYISVNVNLFLMESQTRTSGQCGGEGERMLFGSVSTSLLPWSSFQRWMGDLHPAWCLRMDSITPVACFPLPGCFSVPDATRPTQGLWWWCQYCLQRENEMDCRTLWMSSSYLLLRGKAFHTLCDWQCSHSFRVTVV